MFDKELIRKINNGRCLAFVGSGPSCEMGYPSWEQLARLTYAELGKAGRVSDTTSYEKYLDKKEYPELFRQAERDLGDRSALLKVVESRLVPNKRRSGTLHDLIAKWPFACYLTTNYDDEIETHLTILGEHFTVIGNRQQDFYAWRDGASRLVQKVHGDFNNPDSLILTSADYRHAYVEDGGKYFRDGLCKIFAMFDVFIIGHSLSDPDIDYVLKLARSKRGPQHPIYMVAADFTKADEQEFLEKYNIVLVQYLNRDNSHLELRRMLKTVDRFIGSRGRVWRPDAREPRPTEEVEAAIAIFLYRRLQGVQVVDYLAPLVLSGLQLADRERTPRSDVMSLPMLRGVVANDERYQDAIEETIGNLVRERLVVVIDEDVEITDIGRARVEEYRVVRETEVDQAYGQFTLNAGRIFGALNEEQVKQCRRLAEEVIVDSFANRGSTMAGKVFSGRKALPDELSDIFGLVSNRAVEIADAKLRGAFIEAMHEFVVEPNEAQRRYLASVSQGYFLYHLLGLDPKCAEVRRNIFQKTLWVCDSSVILPLVASGCHNHEYAVELFRMLIGENALLYTTRRLLQEAWEHLDWAVRFMQKRATEPLELLRAASVRGSYKQNLFLDGYIRLSADGEVGTFGEYLKLVFPDGMVRRDAFEDRVVHAGLRVVDTADINERRPVDRSELQTAMDRIRRVREDRGTYRSQLQVESEAEVWILMNSMNSGKLTMRDADVEHVYFVSQSRTMDHVFQSESSITWTPESLYRYLSSLPQRGAMNADLLQQCMLHEYYYAGVSFIDKQRYEQFFGGVIDAARASYEEERNGYIRDLEESYTIGIDEAFHRTVDLEKPFFVAQMGWQRAEALGRREEAALRRAAEAEARVKELESEKDKAWKAREERKRRQEAATLRNLQDPRHARRRQRQAKKRKKRK